MCVHICMYVCMYIYMCYAYVLRPFLFPCAGGRMRALSSALSLSLSIYIYMYWSPLPMVYYGNKTRNLENVSRNINHLTHSLTFPSKGEYI